MNKAIWLSATGIAVAVGMLAVGYVAGRPEAGDRQRRRRRRSPSLLPDSTVNRAEVENIIRDYLVKNPELLLEMQQALETKQREEQRVANLEVIKTAKDEIFNAAYDGYVGNPERQDHDRRVLRLQLRLLQTRPGRHAGADGRRSGPALRAQGIPDPRTGFDTRRMSFRWPSAR